MSDFPFARDQQTLSVRQVAEFLGRDPKTIRRWIKAEQLRAIKTGRDWRILREDLRRFLVAGQNIGLADVL